MEIGQHRYTESMDLFSLGCLFYFCISRDNPYGTDILWASNMVNGKDQLPKIDTMPEAHHLISQLLDQRPEVRPRAADVLCHPMFWDSHTRVQFLCEASNRLEEEKKGSTILQDLESFQSDIWQGKWIDQFRLDFKAEINKTRGSQGSQ